METAVTRDPWWASWFGEEYLAVYEDRDDEEARRQAEKVGAHLAAAARRGRVGFLDLACGTGRHAVVLSRIASVAGLDYSLPFLIEARRRPDVPRPGYVRADMRRLPYASSVFGVVVNFFTSFGYFDDAAEDAAVVREVARVLAPGGIVLADLLNAERVVGTLVSHEEKTVAGRHISIRRSFAVPWGRLEKEITIARDGTERIFRESIRVYRQAALQELFASAGLRVEETWGDFDGSPFHPLRSERLIVLAGRP